MGAKYSVIQFCPDEVRGERINIGVVSFDENGLSFQFLGDWERVRAFGGEVRSLKAIVSEIRRIAPDQLEHVLSSSGYSIQFTPPAYSTLDRDLLLLDVARRFLVDPDVTGRAIRNRQQVIKSTQTALKEAISERINLTAQNLVKSKYEVDGKHDRHRFDVAVANGHALLVADALSFETRRPGSLENSVKLTAWAIEDVRSREDECRIAVVVHPPKHDASEISQSFEHASTMFRSLGAEVVSEMQLDQWADEVADLVAAELPKYLFE